MTSLIYASLILHDTLWVPENGVGVEGGSRVEPRPELLLPVAYTLHVHIRVDRVGLTRSVSQELEIDLVVCGSLRR